MMKMGSIILALVLVLLGLNSMFVVSEGHSALVLQFGRIVQTDYQPGLHFKLPVIQQVMTFDKRILSLDAAPERYFTSEKKSVNVDFYVKWRVADNAAYYRATGGDQLQAAQRLTPIVKDALRFEFNARTLPDLISGGRKDITERVRAPTDASARKNLGIAAHRSAERGQRVGVQAHACRASAAGQRVALHRPGVGGNDSGRRRSSGPGVACRCPA
jgi:membrane protease subunit HflC